MNKYVSTTLTFIGVWFLASLLNGLLSGIGIVMMNGGSINDRVGNLFASFVCSFIFSVPLVGLVWFITIIAQVKEKKGQLLFQLALKAALFCSAAAAIIFIRAFWGQFALASYVVGLCIIVSALTAMLFFRKNIKANE